MKLKELEAALKEASLDEIKNIVSKARRLGLIDMNEYDEYVAEQINLNNLSIEFTTDEIDPVEDLVDQLEILQALAEGISEHVQELVKKKEKL